MSFFMRFFTALSLLLTSSTVVYASSDKIQWHLYLLGITVISTIASIFLIRNKPIETFGIKVLVWGTYFWVFTFVQLTLLAALYYFSN